MILSLHSPSIVHLSEGIAWRTGCETLVSLEVTVKLNLTVGLALS